MLKSLALGGQIKMAIKDWKKITNKKDHLAWEKKNGDFQVMIYNFKGWKGRYFERGNGNIRWEPSNIRNFKTKSQALKYAKSYMRKH